MEKIHISNFESLPNWYRKYKKIQTLNFFTETTQRPFKMPNSVKSDKVPVLCSHTSTVRQQWRREVWWPLPAAVIRDTPSCFTQLHGEEKNPLYPHVRTRVLTSHKWSYSAPLHARLTRWFKRPKTVSVFCLSEGFLGFHTLWCYILPFRSEDTLSLEKMLPRDTPLTFLPGEQKAPGSINIGLLGAHLRWCWDGTIPLSDFRHISPAD